MPNILFKAWVKNVDTLRKLTSKSSGNPSTNSYISIYNKQTKWVQTLFIQCTLPHSSTTPYTYIISKFNLLNKSFTYYPQSLLIRPLKEI